MLHTRIHKSRMAVIIKQLMPECTSCVARGPMWTMQQLSTLDPPQSVIQELTEEMAERISATIGQENITRPNERNVEQK